MATRIWWLLLSFFVSSLATSQTNDDEFETVQIYLHTVDVGAMVFNNFGHTALRVVDPRTGSDLVYNWGMFDFGEPVSFSLRFVSGVMDYKLGVYPFRAAMRGYEIDERTVWEDQLLLTNQEKKNLLQTLAWNQQPGNETYAYHYFKDNCSTRPRDYLDRALNGRLQKVTNPIATVGRYRDRIRSHYRSIPFIAVSLDLLLNHRADEPLSQWKEMFAPLVLRDLLLHQVVDGRYLLKEGRTLVEFPAPPPSILNSWVWFAGFFWLLILPGWLLYRFKSRTWGRRLIGVAAIFYGIYGGFMGAMMPWVWAFSGHLDGHHNANQWLFWPTEGLLVILGFFWLRRAVRWRWLKTYAQIHQVSGVLLALFYLIGQVEQDVSLVLLTFLPVSLALYGFAIHDRES